MAKQRSWGPAPSVVVLLFVLLAGCILTGAPDDLSVVCERKSGSPWHPYTPDEVKAMTLIEPGVSEAGVDDATRVAADALLTLGARPYAAFEAHLFPVGGDGWVFDGNGTTQNGTDRYQLAFAARDGTLVALDETVAAPATLVTLAAAVVAQDPEAAALAAAEPSGGTWREEEASCVRLTYPGGEVAVVNLAQLRVVALL